MSTFDEIKKTVNGALTIAEWLGAGGRPVSRAKAEARAKACLLGNNGKPCIFNVAPRWWDTTKGSIAEAIRKHLQVKNDSTITVSCEDDLHMCAKCGCCLKLKVHVPTEHVRNSLPANKVSDMPGFCWIKQEIESTH